GLRDHHRGTEQGGGAGLPLLPRARPGPARPAARLGGADPRVAPRVARDPAGQAAGGLGDHRGRDDRHPQPRGPPPRRTHDRPPRAERLPPAAPPPAAAPKWWPTGLARRANDTGTELASLPITPADVARIAALVGSGALNDKLARQVIEGVLAGEGSPDEVVA